MNDKDDGADRAARLRWRAEELAERKAAQPRGAPELLSVQDLQQALHELRVHQFELEMQNEELRRAQSQLETARARYFDLYDLAPLGYCVVSVGGLILETNLTAVSLLGVARAALIKQPITRFIHSDDQDLYYRHRRQFLQTGDPYDCDLRMVKSDGTWFWAHLAAVAVPEPTVVPELATTAEQDNGLAAVSRIVLSDITERKRLEEELDRSTAMLRATQHLARVGSWEWDARTRVTFWTEEMYRLHEFDPRDVAPGPELIARGMSCYDPEDRPQIQAAFQRCTENGEPYDLELRFTTAKGRLLRVRASAEPVVESGEVVRVVGFLMDLGDRRASA